MVTSRCQANVTMGIPTHSYLVCATPRSGSTLLCEMLAATGRAGRPQEHFEVLRHSGLPRQPREYFDDADPVDVPEHLAPLERGQPISEPAQAWWTRTLAAGLSDNGVWAGKLMWGHVDDFLSRARDLDGLAGAALETVLRTLLGDPKLVYVARADKVGQAVSLWRAVQTQTWRSDGGRTRDDSHYDFAAIHHLVAQLEDQDRAWQGWFAGSGFAPLELTYEALEDDPRRCVASVLRALGLPDGDVPAPPTARQRDARSDEWIARYLEDSKALA
jgi:trehalose 2-sulfotransferase